MSQNLNKTVTVILTTPVPKPTVPHTVQGLGLVGPNNDQEKVVYRFETDADAKYYRTQLGSIVPKTIHFK